MLVLRELILYTVYEATLIALIEAVQFDAMGILSYLILFTPMLSCNHLSSMDVFCIFMSRLAVMRLE